MSYSYLGQHERAIAEFSKAIQLVPDDAALFRERGRAYASVGSFDKAIADFEQEMAMRPTRAEWYQGVLKKEGFYVGPIDGIYGAGTKEALIKCLQTGCAIPE